eukprot:COSAG02_NODE_1918_length_10386_cov_16.728492_3_plen_412_part_00
MSSDARAEAARQNRHRSLLALPSVTEPPEPEPEPEPEPDALLAASAAALRGEVALWRERGEKLLQRASCVVPTNAMLALPAAFAEVVDTLELQLAQAAAVLAFEANPEALRCVLMWAVRAIGEFTRITGCAGMRSHMPCRGLGAMERCVCPVLQDVHTIGRTAQVRRAWRDASSDLAASAIWWKHCVMSWPSTALPLATYGSASIARIDSSGRLDGAATSAPHQKEQEVHGQVRGQIAARLTAADGGASVLSDPKMLFRGMTLAMRTGLNVVRPWPTTTKRRAPVRQVEDLRFLTDVHFGDRVIHSSCTAGSVSPHLFPLIVQEDLDRIVTTCIEQAQHFPMLIDVPIEPGSCVIRQEGVDLSSQEVVGSDWENPHWATFRYVCPTHAGFDPLLQQTTPVSGFWPMKPLQT